MRCSFSAYLFWVLSLWVRSFTAGENTIEPSGTMLVAVVTVNSQAKGEFFIFLDDNNRYWLRQEDFAAIGLKDITVPPTTIDNEPRIALDSIPELQVKFDLNNLALEIQSAPKLLGRAVVDFAPKHRSDILRPTDNSAFLNYRLNHAGSDGATTGSFMLNNEIGLRLGSWLLTSNHNYNYSDTGAVTTRLMSSLYYDQRDTLQRLTLGDFFSNSGVLGNNFNLGGISFAKRYDMDPYQSIYPMAKVLGAVAMPSTAEVYIGGMRLDTIKLNPGEFVLENLNYFGGLQNIQVIVTDNLGRQQVLDYNFYFSSYPLRLGLHEYNYSLGKQRRNFGTANSGYGDLVGVAWHRYGFTDWFTAGLHSDVEPGRYRVGVDSALKLGVGSAASSIAYSHSAAKGAGFAYQMDYEYQAHGYALGLMQRGSINTYTLSTASAAYGLPKAELGLNFSFGYPGVGNFGINYRTADFYDKPKQQSATLRYSTALPGSTNLFVSLSHIDGAITDYEGGVGVPHISFMAGISWNPEQGLNVSALHSVIAKASSSSINLNKNAPEAEGLGYGLAITRQQVDDEAMHLANMSLQYNGPYGIYTAERTQMLENTPGSFYELTMAGGLGYVAGHVEFSRPINDSFALVQVGDNVGSPYENIAGVKVYQNNEFVGQTDRHGLVFAPNLGSFIDNSITIDDKDIPIEYSLSTKEQQLNPPWRSGSLIKFAAQRIQAIIGRLLRRNGAVTIAQEFIAAQIKMGGVGVSPTSPSGGVGVSPTSPSGGVGVSPTSPRGVGDKTIELTTGRGGEFYLENLPLGTHYGSLDYGAGTCQFSLVVPESSEMFIDLGEIWCE